MTEKESENKRLMTLTKKRRIVSGVLTRNIINCKDGKLKCIHCSFCRVHRIADLGLMQNVMKFHHEMVFLAFTKYG
jgi:hypothetical protein